MDELSYTQLECMRLGAKLREAAKLEPAALNGQLITVYRELREALITVGLRKRKIMGKRGEKGGKSGAKSAKSDKGK